MDGKGSKVRIFFSNTVNLCRFLRVRLSHIYWKPSSMKVTSNFVRQVIPTEPESTGRSSFSCCRVRQSGKCAEARTQAPLCYLKTKQQYRLSYMRKVQSFYGTLNKYSTSLFLHFYAMHHGYKCIHSIFMYLFWACMLCTTYQWSPKGYNFVRIDHTSYIKQHQWMLELL